MKGVIGITQSKDATANEKYRKIESLVNDYLMLAEANIVNLELIDQELVR